jgi:hypothetical protein
MAQRSATQHLRQGHTIHWPLSDHASTTITNSEKRDMENMNDKQWPDNNWPFPPYPLGVTA